MNNPKISVIIPIYNVERYIEETLNSLVNQTIFDDIEVLMIDDGSTDNSRYIIEKYALDYDNFHAFHKKNEGQSVARNFGLEYAKGEYIHFLDSDDLITSDAYERLYEVACLDDYDFVVGNVLRFDRYNCREDKLFKNSFKNLNENIKLTNIDDHPSLVWDTIACNKLIKKDFLIEKDIKFVDHKLFFEDLLYAVECYCKSKSFIFINEYFYYWRVRDNSSSVTQNNKTLKNFEDRLQILRLIDDLIKKYDVSDSTLNALYEKWLTHDLMLYLKKINDYPEDKLDELLNQVFDILSLVPVEIKENLNSFNKIVYRMIENRDLEGLLYFAPLENKLKKNPDLKLNLKAEYLDLIHFEDDALKEELNVKKIDLDYDDDSIFIEFEAKINYLSLKCPHSIEAILVDENDNGHSLEVNENHILIPFDLIKIVKFFKIKIKYLWDSNCRESYLINTKRQSIIVEDRDLEIGIGLNKIFFANTRKIHNDILEIDEVSLEDELFVLCGKSRFKPDSVSIDNVITYERISYPVKFSDDENFTFTIPYSDLISHPIRKWELKSDYLMKLPNKITFFKNHNEIYFANTRNKILISEDIYDSLKKLSKLNDELLAANSKNKNLTRENKKLKRKNSKLNDRNVKLSNQNEQLKKVIEEYKSRKVVKIADKIKGHN